VEQFDEDQELQQVIDGQVCMKVYHFAGIFWRSKLLCFLMLEFFHIHY
jgi:hypothetical protein